MLTTSPANVTSASTRIPAETTAGATTAWAVAAPQTQGTHDRVRLTAVTLWPDEAITADPTDYTTLQLVNAGSDGTGTTVLATRSYASGDADALAPDTFALVADAVEPGDLLVLKRAVAGTGMATPAGLVRIDAVVWNEPTR